MRARGRRHAHATKPSPDRVTVEVTIDRLGSGGGRIPPPAPHPPPPPPRTPPAPRAPATPLPAPLPPLRPLLLRPGGVLARAVTAVGGALDLRLMGPLRLGLAERQALAEFAETHALARIAVSAGMREPAEPVVARRPVTARF